MHYHQWRTQDFSVLWALFKFLVKILQKLIFIAFCPLGIAHRFWVVLWENAHSRLCVGTPLIIQSFHI